MNNMKPETEALLGVADPGLAGVSKSAENPVKVLIHKRTKWHKPADFGGTGLSYVYGDVPILLFSQSRP